eukprot:327280_1
MSIFNWIFQNEPGVIIDNGSRFTKCGLAGDDSPRCIFPSIVGTLDDQVSTAGRHFYVGNDAKDKTDILLKYPIQHGIITNWDTMEKIWEYSFNELQVDPSEQQLLMTDAPLNPKSNREKMVQIVFEKFDIPSFFVQVQSVLSLYSTGRTTGIVLDSGYQVTYTVPIYHGYCLSTKINRLNLAGSDLTEYLSKVLMEKGYSFTTYKDKNIVSDMKEKLCFISQNYGSEMLKFEQSSESDEIYILPDGEIISLGAEKFGCGEILFKPSLIGVESEGIDKMLHKSILRCDSDIRDELYENIILSGGNTMIKGIQYRIQKEMKLFDVHEMKINITANDERKYSSWIGGSIISSLSSFDDLLISRREYDEYGASIVHRKCN